MEEQQPKKKEKKDKKDRKDKKEKKEKKRSRAKSNVKAADISQAELIDHDTEPVHENLNLVTEKQSPGVKEGSFGSKQKV